MNKPQIIHTIKELRASLKEARMEGKTIGYLCTTGKLHSGHAKLAQVAKERADIVVVSNTGDLTQWVDAEENSKPNVSTDNDAEVLAAVGVDILFAAPREELYPDGWQGHTFVEVPEVTKILDDPSRVGHYFRGAATATLKLFNIVQPDISVWGEKDYQQFHVIRKMVKDLSLPVEVISVPSIRYESGLAYSSRNANLSDSEWEAAPCLYRAMLAVRTRLLGGMPPEQAVKGIEEYLNKRGMTLDYIQVRDASTLAPAKEGAIGAIIFAAAFLGTERLVDTLRV